MPALQAEIRQVHGLESTWLHSVPVVEAAEGKKVWDCEVQVFAVKHAKATRAYAWSDEAATGKRRLHVVLGVAPIDSAQSAVKAAITSAR